MMKTEVLLQEIQNIPEFEKEVLWYLNQYPDSNAQPWEKIINELFIDFDVKLTHKDLDFNKKYLIGFAILTEKYKIVENYSPGTYRIHFGQYGYLDEIEDISTFYIKSFILLIRHYYKAFTENEMEYFKNALSHEINKWNCSPYVKQEEVRALIDSHTLVETAKIAKVEVDLVPEIISHYYNRINKKKFDNLESFLTKVENIYETNTKLRKNTTYLNYIMDQVKNGGVDIKSPYDLISSYNGIQFN